MVLGDSCGGSFRSSGPKLCGSSSPSVNRCAQAGGVGHQHRQASPPNSRSFWRQPPQGVHRMRTASHHQHRPGAAAGQHHGRWPRPRRTRPAGRRRSRRCSRRGCGRARRAAPRRRGSWSTARRPLRGRRGRRRQASRMQGLVHLSVPSRRAWPSALGATAADEAGQQHHRHQVGQRLDQPAPAPRRGRAAPRPAGGSPGVEKAEQQAGPSAQHRVPLAEDHRGQRHVAAAGRHVGNEVGVLRQHQVGTGQAQSTPFSQRRVAQPSAPRRRRRPPSPGSRRPRAIAGRGGCGTAATTRPPPPPARRRRSALWLSRPWPSRPPSGPPCRLQQPQGLGQRAQAHRVGQGGVCPPCLNQAMPSTTVSPAAVMVMAMPQHDLVAAVADAGVAMQQRQRHATPMAASSASPASR
jgi:hypothetical protein